MNTYVFKDDVVNTTLKPVMPEEGARVLVINDIQPSISIHGWKTLIIVFDYNGYQFSQTFADCDYDERCSEERAMIRKIASINGSIQVGDKVACLIGHKYSSKHNLNWPVVLDVDTVIR